MAEDGFVAPPPGFVPSSRPEVEVVAEPGDFIELPPGIEPPPAAAKARVDVDSVTYRVPAPGPAAAERPTPPVFFPVTAPGPPPSVDATRITAARPVVAQWRLLLPTGETIVLAAATLVGRDPAPVSGWEDAALQRLRDPAKTVSKTHAALEVTGTGELRVHDLNSTNGVALGYAGDLRREVTPREPSILDSGVRIHLGDFTVVAERLT